MSNDENINKILFYVIILCSIILFMFIGTNVHAAAVYGQSGCNSTYYNIEKMNGDSTYGQTSTSYNISWAFINFYGTENLKANTYYDLVITFRSTITNNIFNDDGGDNVGIRGMHLFQTSSLCGSHTGEASITSYNISGTKLTVRILTGSSLYDYWQWYQRFTFVGSNGINSAVFTEVDTTGASGIIENANDNTNTIVNNNNQNTQDIINNNNENSEKLNENIDSTFSCTNLWNDKTSQVWSDNHWVYQDVTITKAGTYYFKSNYSHVIINGSHALPYSTTLSPGTYTIYFGSTSSTIDPTISKSMISLYDKPYCVYGGTIMSETNDAINDLNDTLTNPNVSSGLIDDILDSDFYHNDDLTSIVVAPLTLLNSLIDSSNTCQPLELPFQIKIGSFYDKSSTGASFPCGSILWSHANSTLVSIYRVVVCGFIYFHLCIYAWKVLDTAIDPFKDKLEVIDL